MQRALKIFATTSLLLLLAAPAALADAQEPLSGMGSYGEAGDKVITNVGFIVLAFFPLLILCMSLIQWQLDKRKDRRKALAKRVGASRWDGGW
ncbi:MAG: hypothetical protein LT070_10005 [Solirubrobacteraceae bacterium]|nr:hypothetical protein [Solirubrobacteraceae bacterium]